jgi:hypothetical protein
VKDITEWIAEKTVHYERGTIPLDRALCCWTANDGTDFVFLDSEKVRIEGTPEAKLWDNASSTLGACVHDWLEGRNPRHTPLGRFAEMGHDGQLGAGKEFVRKLEQFAKIEGCEWAVQMLAALHMGQFLHGDDETWI